MQHVAKSMHLPLSTSNAHKCALNPQASYPRVLKDGAPSEEVQFHLSCQQYIELVR